MVRIPARNQTAGMGTDLKTYIGLQVKTARLRIGWTQEHLAERVDKAVETISNIERGNTWSGIPTLGKIAFALDVPIKEMFPEWDELKKSNSRLAKEAELEVLVSALSDDDLQTLIKVATSLKQ